MAALEIPCGSCSTPVPPEFWNRPEGVRCPTCGHEVRVVVFPAIEHTRAGASPEPLAIETEASCFYHPQSRAAVPCDECGRFLCRLCDLELDGRHLCPACFQAGIDTRKLAHLERRRTMYDSIALALAGLCAVRGGRVAVTAPAALYTVIRRWRAPGSIVPRTRIRYYLAAVFALAEIAGFALVIWAIVNLPRLTAVPQGR
jgi:DNA-directed RNA polymerase subunit RPC12/RpoP